MTDDGNMPISMINMAFQAAEMKFGAPGGQRIPYRPVVTFTKQQFAEVTAMAKARVEAFMAAEAAEGEGGE